MKKYYTNCLRYDGFGATYQSLISTILYAEVYCSGNFVYTKTKLDHIYGYESEKLEEIMNIYNNFKNIDTLTFEDKSKVEIVDIHNSLKVMDQNMDLFLNSDTMKKIRNVFKSNKIMDILDKKNHHIAIHIRRPSLHLNIDNSSEHGEGWDKTTMNINQLTQKTARFTEDLYFIDIINKIREKNKEKNNIFHIISEGSIQDFSNFTGDDLIFHLNDTIEKSIILMVMSDILVISCSSFSYCAALLNENTVIYNNKFWHAKASYWL